MTTADQIAQSTELASLAKIATAGGSASAVIFGLSADVVGIVAGILIALCGLIYNIWSTERKLKILRKRAQDDE